MRLNTRQAVVQQQRAPLAVVAEAHLVRARRVDRLGRQQHVEQLGPLGEQREGRDEPTVAERLLTNVVGGRHVVEYAQAARGVVPWAVVGVNRPAKQSVHQHRGQIARRGAG
jgi:hypothetical protein